MENRLQTVAQHVKRALVGHIAQNPCAQQQHRCHKAAVAQLPQQPIALVPVDENHHGAQQHTHKQANQKAFQPFAHLRSSC